MTPLLTTSRKTKTTFSPGGVIVSALLIATCTVSFAGCRGCGGQTKRGRTTPICAVQDCNTGAIIDNGCSDDGKCMACVNTCPPKAAAVPDASQ